MRGSHRRPSVLLVAVGSIPACAGQPRAAARGLTLPPVYPRVCGAALKEASERSLHEGLSPRVRGSQTRRFQRGVIRGSIPACAGQPFAGCSSTGQTGVYPRVCGAAVKNNIIPAVNEGLSPRVRGSPPDADRFRRPAGSIPACAGQPWSCQNLLFFSEVYPRVCGAAMGAGISVRASRGLSPRVRGSRICRAFPHLFLRSIPACAGQPYLPRFPASLSPVYPRVCGAASRY